MRSSNLNRIIYNGTSFKSFTEFGYALLLNKLGKEWYYEEMRVPYVNMMNGKRGIYVIDFTVVDGNKVEWIEAIADGQMIPNDKRIYAERRAEESDIIYRGLREDEINESWDLIHNGHDFDGVEFVHRTPRSTNSKVTYYFKSEQEAVSFELEGWRQFTKPTNRGALWKKTLVREK